MKRRSVSVTGVGVSPPIPLDGYISPFAVGFGTVVSGTGTYSIQHTFDDVFSPIYTPASGTWYTHSSFTSATANGDGNYAFPVTAVRLNVLTSTSSMSVTATFIQAGLVGG